MENEYTMICTSNDITQGVEYTPLTTVNGKDPDITFQLNSQEIQHQPAYTATDSTNKMLTEILGEIRAQKQQIGRLTEEVIALRNEVRQLKLSYSPDINNNLVPPLPVKSLQQLKELHQQLQEKEDVVVQLKYILGKVGGDCTNSFVRNAIKKILSDDVAAKLSWRGTNNKPSIQEFSIPRIITNVCHTKFPKADAEGIKKVLQQHFVHACDRLRKGDRTKKHEERK